VSTGLFQTLNEMLDAQRKRLSILRNNIPNIVLLLLVRRRGFWDHRRCELTEALAHQDCHFRRPLVDEASGVV